MKISESYRRTVRKPRLCSWKTHTCLLPGIRWKKQIEIAQGSGQFPAMLELLLLQHSYPQLPTSVKTANAKESMHWGAWSWLRTWHCIWMGQGWPLLALAKEEDQELSGILTGLQCPLWALLLQWCSPLGQRSCWEEEECTLRENEPTQTRPSWLLLQHLGTRPHPW